MRKAGSGGGRQGAGAEDKESAHAVPVRLWPKSKEEQIAG